MKAFNVMVLFHWEKPLLWIPLTENFFDSRFSGNGNIGHFILEAQKLFQED